ncbi:MAG TPA: SDR family NAD(P)-dependent oxidoreductase [Chthoniobacterales bacterium]|nr:SDR family NAD(P)-dependent oxidoreductase [Chthoniobacterales bacterium]
MSRVFLTGASSGIGSAIAKTLTAAGHEVWGTSRDPSRIPELPKLHPVKLDLLSPQSIEEAFNAALAEAGHIDVLINNAGAGHFGPAESLPIDVIENQFQLLVLAHIRLMQRAISAMRAGGGGLIINVTSLASRLPVPFMGAYNAAKAAMAAYSMSIQLEFPNTQVHVVDLQPADICTEFNEAVIKSAKNDPRYEAKLETTWNTVAANMSAAPKPELVARRVLALIEQKNPPPRVTVGDALQSKIAPLIFRFLPQRVRIWGLKRYYKI